MARHSSHPTGGPRPRHCRCEPRRNSVGVRRTKRRGTALHDLSRQVRPVAGNSLQFARRHLTRGEPPPRAVRPYASSIECPAKQGGCPAAQHAVTDGQQSKCERERGPMSPAKKGAECNIYCSPAQQVILSSFLPTPPRPPWPIVPRPIGVSLREHCVGPRSVRGRHRPCQLPPSRSDRDAKLRRQPFPFCPGARPRVRSPERNGGCWLSR